MSSLRSTLAESSDDVDRPKRARPQRDGRVPSSVVPYRTTLAPMHGFRYVLELLSGDSADPMMFNSALPPEAWRPGDTFLAGSGLERFRILAIDEEVAGVLVGHADAIWIVAPA